MSHGNSDREYTIEQLIELTKLQDQQVCLLDVRLDLEREQSKINVQDCKAIINEKHIPIPRPTFQNETHLYHYLTPYLNDLSQDELIIIYCRGGSRSLCVTNILIDKMGFKPAQVFSLQGGIEAWNTVNRVD